MKSLILVLSLLSTLATFAKEQTPLFLGLYFPDRPPKDGYSDEYYRAKVFFKQGDVCEFFKQIPPFIGGGKYQDNCYTSGVIEDVEKVEFSLFCAEKCDGVYFSHFELQFKESNKLIIPALRWVDEVSDDRTLKKTFYSPTHANFDTYIIEIGTSNDDKSGTDARVKMDIFGTGSNAKVISYQPDSFENNFEKGAFEQFELSTLHLGDITKVCLFNDGTGSNPDWKPELVWLTSKKTGKTYKLKGLGQFISTTKKCFSIE